MSAQAFFNDTLPSKLAGNADTAKSIGAIYQFDITGDNGGTWTVDLTKDADFVSEGGNDGAQCTVSIDSGDFMDIVEGRLPGAQAFMLGKLKVQGDMGLAMKLTTILG